MSSSIVQVTRCYGRCRARKMFFLFFMFFKERDLFFCSLKNAILGQMFFIFRKYYILIHKAMISWPIMLTLSPPQSHPVPDFTIVTLKWHNTTLNCHCHLSSLLTGMLSISEILLNCHEFAFPCLLPKLASVFKTRAPNLSKILNNCMLQI